MVFSFLLLQVRPPSCDVGTWHENLHLCGISICFIAFILVLRNIIWVRWWLSLASWKQLEISMSVLGWWVPSTFLGADRTRGKHIARSSPKNRPIGYPPRAFLLEHGIRAIYLRAWCCGLIPDMSLKSGQSLQLLWRSSAGVFAWSYTNECAWVTKGCSEERHSITGSRALEMTVRVRHCSPKLRMVSWIPTIWRSVIRRIFQPKRCEKIFAAPLRSSVQSGISRFRGCRPVTETGSTFRWGLDGPNRWFLRFG